MVVKSKTKRCIQLEWNRKRLAMLVGKGTNPKGIKKCEYVEYLEKPAIHKGHEEKHR